jgi:hypothetical protein
LTPSGCFEESGDAMLLRADNECLRQPRRVQLGQC